MCLHEKIEGGDPMRKSLYKPISILLTFMIILSLFTILPITTAGAEGATTGDDPWIFEVNNGVVYDLDGKWVRFGDEDFQLSGTGELTLTARTTYIYQLKYGNKHIADSRSTQAGPVHIGNTVYVTGQGTEEHPYIFTPNMLFYKTGGTIANGATVAMGYENEAALPNTNNGVAVPGDGFKGASRMLVGSGNSVEFAEHPGEYYQPYKNTAYIGVSEAGQYGWRISASNIYSGYGFDFDSGNDTLYYIGKDSSAIYHFAESLSLKTDFGGENKVVCTVTWENQDGTKLKTMTYDLGETADDGGLTPTKAEDAAYTYSFTGFEPSYEPLADDMTYVATYEATPKGPMNYQVNSWIFSTNDGRVYDTVDDLEHKCYRYNGTIGTFPAGGGAFSVVNDQLLLCDLVVADIDTSKTYKTFANTVYVTGDGTQEDPFIFNPNYIYGDTTKANVKDGPAIAVPGVSQGSGDKGSANPGDGFKAMSRIRVGTNNVQFLQQIGYYRASRSLLGVGETTYGYRYSKTKALPFSFVSDDHVLYYFEKNDSNIYQFSETKPPLKRSFSPSDSTIHTVTWRNEDGTVLDTETYYVNDIPSYKGTAPYKPRSGRTVYTLTGWADDTNTYSGDLPPVTADVTYTATFSAEEKDLFSGYSLTLSGDIGVNFFLDLTAAEVEHGVVVDFVWTVKGTPKTASYTVTPADLKSNGYYKSTCWVVAAEMNYPITATVKINGVEQEETATQSVRQYAGVILANPSTYTPTGKSVEALVDIVKKMLDYGAKAQVEFGRMDVALANTGVDYTMDPVDPDDIPDQKSDMTDGLSSYGLEYAGTSIIYLTQTTLRHYYKPIGGTVSEDVKAAARASGFEFGTKGSYVYFDKKNIGAADLDTIYEISFDGTKKYGFSVWDYLKLVMKSTKTSDNEKLLAQATYHYSIAANTYFGH